MLLQVLLYCLLLQLPENIEKNHIEHFYSLVLLILNEFHN